MIKLTNNTHRDHLRFANEVALIAEHMGLSARDDPRGQRELSAVGVARPGLGGPCLEKDADPHRQPPPDRL
jgi:UDP-N-acetyl-D-mannosaminuronate dehydrogenase